MRNKDRKEEIIDTSYQLFINRGYDNVSVMDICRACQITKPTFYKYIPSKEDLLVLYYDGTIETLLDILGERKDDPDTFDQIWKGVSYVLERSLEFGHDLYSRYLQYIFKLHRPTKRYDSPVRDYVLILIKKAQETGQIKNMASPEEIFLILRNSCLGLSCQWCFGQGEFDLLGKYYEAYCTVMHPDWDVINELTKDMPKDEDEE